MFGRRLSLKFSISGAFAIVVALSAMAMGWSTYEVARSHFRENLRNKIRDYAVLCASFIDLKEHQSILGPQDEASPAYLKIRQTLQSIKNSSPEIRFIYTLRTSPEGLRFAVDAETDPETRSAAGDIYEDASPNIRNFLNSKQLVFVEDVFTSDKWGTFLSGYAALGDPSNGSSAMVGVDITAEYVQKAEADLAKVIAICTLLTILLVLVFSQYLAKKLSISVTRLTQEVQLIQSLNLEERPPIRSEIREIHELSKALAAMKRGLKSFKKYVPSDLVTDLLQLGIEARLGTEKKNITILFSDIADFTSISEKLSSEQLAQCMAEYLDVFIAVTREYKGTIDKFIGDAVMVIWGAPHDQANHCELACLTAIKVQERLAELNHKLVSAGLPALRTRIGVHTGEVTVGNIGTEERMSYTAIGDPVNTASRLEGLNKFYGTQILISQAVLSSVSSLFLARFVDKTLVQGKDHALDIHELVYSKAEAAQDLKQRVAQYNEAMGALLAGDVDKADAGIRLLLLGQPEDKLLLFQREVIATAKLQAGSYHFEPRIVRQK